MTTLYRKLVGASYVPTCQVEDCHGGAVAVQKHKLCGFHKMCNSFIWVYVCEEHFTNELSWFDNDGAIREGRKGGNK